MSDTNITGAPGTSGSGSDPSSTKDQAQQAAGTAADEGRHVAGVAADEVKSVAGEAQAHAKGLLDEAMVQVSEQTRTQGARVASTLQTFSDDLESMAQSGTGGLAADLARQAADRARTLGQHLDGREPSDLLDDVRRFARDRPGTFLLGALVAGVAAGRLARGAKDAGSASTSDATSATGVTGRPGITGTAGTTPAAPVPITPATTAAPQYTSDVPTRSDEDPLGLDSPAIGSTIPPASPARFEP